MRAQHSRSMWAQFRFRLICLLYFGVDYRLTLYDKLMRFSQNNVPAVDTIRGLLQRMKKSKDLRHYVVQEWVNGLEGGQLLHEVMASSVPKMDTILIRAGSQNGDLALGLRQAMFLTDAMRRMKAAVIGALTMPIILALMSSGILVIVVTQLAPQMKTAFGKTELPAITKALISLGEFVISWGWLVALVIVVSFAASIWSLSKWTGVKGSLRSKLDNSLPPWALYREVQASGTLIALYALLMGNVQVRVATEMIAGNAGPWLSRHLRSAVRTMSAGGKEAEAFDTGLFPKDIQEDIEDYGRHSSFGEVLSAIAKTLVERTEKRVNRYGAVLQGVVFLVVGSFAAWMYLAMLWAGFEMYQSMRSQMTF